MSTITLPLDKCEFVQDLVTFSNKTQVISSLSHLINSDPVSISFYLIVSGIPKLHTGQQVIYNGSIWLVESSTITTPGFLKNRMIIQDTWIRKPY